jgi:hypothetical protein
MDFLQLAIAGLNFLGSAIGTFGHVGTFCASAGPALRIGSSGLDLPTAIRIALVGTPTC